MQNTVGPSPARRFTCTQIQLQTASSKPPAYREVNRKQRQKYCYTQLLTWSVCSIDISYYLFYDLYGLQVNDEMTTCEGLGRVAAMLDDVVYRDQQVPLSRDSTLLKSLLPGDYQHSLVGHNVLTTR